MEGDSKDTLAEDEDSLSENYDSSDCENEIEYFLTLMSEEDKDPNQKEEPIQIKTEPPDSPPSSTDPETQCSSIVPPRNNWGGKYYFKLRFHYLSLSGKTDCSCFSTMQNKLYITKDHAFRTMCTSRGVPDGSKLRASLYYTAPEFSNLPVNRCPVHAQKDLAKGSTMSEHVLQVLDDQAVYEKDEKTGRFSVVIPYKEPKVNEFVVYSFKLTCFSSCLGGINRRNIRISFSLENNGVLLGRQTLAVKICASPSRDMKQEELKYSQLKASQNKSSTEGNSLLDRTILPEPETETAKESDKYTITTTDPKLYKFLSCMKEFFEISKYIEYQLDLQKYLPT